MRLCIWTLRKLKRSVAFQLLIAHLLPSATATCLYIYFIRGMEIGGGPEPNIIGTIVSTLSLITGGPLAGYGSLIAATFVFLTLGFAYFRCWQADRATAARYMTIIVLSGVVVLLKTRHSEIYPRYFLVPVAFAFAAVRQLRRAVAGADCTVRLCQIAFVCVYVVGNG